MSFKELYSPARNEFWDKWTWHVCSRNLGQVPETANQHFRDTFILSLESLGMTPSYSIKLDLKPLRAALIKKKKKITEGSDTRPDLFTHT